jgi:hypothetical protein
VLTVAGVYGETIHQLAARKGLQEPEEGVGCLHRGGDVRRVGEEGGCESRSEVWCSERVGFLSVQREEEEEAVVVSKEEMEVEQGI